MGNCIGHIIREKGRLATLLKELWMKEGKEKILKIIDYVKTRD